MKNIEEQLNKQSDAFANHLTMIAFKSKLDHEDIQNLFKKYCKTLLEEAQKEARELVENDYEIGFEDGYKARDIRDKFDFALMVADRIKAVQKFKNDIKDTRVFCPFCSEETDSLRDLKCHLTWCKEHNFTKLF